MPRKRPKRNSFPHYETCAIFFDGRSVSATSNNYPNISSTVFRSDADRPQKLTILIRDPPVLLLCLHGTSASPVGRFQRMPRTLPSDSRVLPLRRTPGTNRSVEFWFLWR